MSVTQRYLLRAGLAAVLAGLAAAGTAVADGAFSLADGVAVGTALVGAFSAWAGIGAAVPQVEPHVGNKL